MRRVWSVTIAIAFILVATQALARDRAILVAAQKYARSGNLGPVNLRGPTNDLKEFRKVLLAYGFDEGDIVSIDTGQSTKANILGAFAQAKKLTGPLDRFVFFFAGHGTSIPCALLPEDAMTDKGLENVLQVDELRALMLDVSANQRYVVLDSCFSGGFKGGIPETVGLRFFEPLVQEKGPVGRGAVAESLGNSPDICFVSSAGEYQTAQETASKDGVFRGLFSDALCSVLLETKQNKSGNLDWATALQKVIQRMQPLLLPGTQQVPSVRPSSSQASFVFADGMTTGGMSLKDVAALCTFEKGDAGIFLAPEQPRIVEVGRRIYFAPKQDSPKQSALMTERIDDKLFRVQTSRLGTDKGNTPPEQLNQLFDSVVFTEAVDSTLKFFVYESYWSQARAFEMAIPRSTSGAPLSVMRSTRRSAVGPTDFSAFQQGIIATKSFPFRVEARFIETDYSPTDKDLDAMCNLLLNPSPAERSLMKALLAGDGGPSRVSVRNLYRLIRAYRGNPKDSKHRARLTDGLLLIVNLLLQDQSVATLLGKGEDTVATTFAKIESWSRRIWTAAEYAALCGAYAQNSKNFIQLIREKQS